ncbi:hypothetical protein C5F59_035125 [Streptomyces sp. QL37]|uniref:hypothetical protein n=1 Tax=Streptomyces sp. QL37 TaxID=2093747 RepID=UPI000CF2EF51|nr:hypothetical protein [Streptomyces sp. QL37]PPQ61412.1 hypothetical protein C5F59_35605 [Streptomyces sp. QL37]
MASACFPDTRGPERADEESARDRPPEPAVRPPGRAARGLPEGLPRPERRVVEQPLPRPGAGEALVRNTDFQALPALRTLIGGGVEGAPFSGPNPEEALFGPAVGEAEPRPGTACGGDGLALPRPAGVRGGAVLDAEIARLTWFGEQLASRVGAVGPAVR